MASKDTTPLLMESSSDDDVGAVTSLTKSVNTGMYIKKIEKA